jgi:hypothetical protein
MKTRGSLSLALVCALLAIVVGGSSVAASGSYLSSLTQTACRTTGGANGYGYTKGRAFIEEVGTSGTNYVTMTARLQRWTGSAWSTRRSRTWISEVVPNDSTSYYAYHTFKFDFTSSDAPHTNRLSVVFKWWDQRSGADRLLHTSIRNGPSC